METFSALLAICAENSPVPGEFPTQRPVTRSFDVYFDLRPNKRLSKQSWGWWFETQSRPLWRHRNGLGGKQLLHISVTNQFCDSYMSINPSGGCENRNLLRAKTVRKTVGCNNFNDRFDCMAETLYTRTKRCYHLNRPSSQLNHISKRGRWCHQTFSKIIYRCFLGTWVIVWWKYQTVQISGKYSWRICVQSRDWVRFETKSLLWFRVQ